MYREVLNKNIANNMKEGNYLITELWRSIKSEFTLYEKSDNGGELTDAVEIKIIKKMLDQRLEDIKQYQMADRQAMVHNLQIECDVLTSLLPKEVSEDEIKNAVEEFMSSKDQSYKFSMKDMKDVQAFVKDKYPIVNGGAVASIFKQKINF